MIAVFSQNALAPTQSHFIVVKLQLPFYAGQSQPRSGFSQDYGTPVTSTGEDLQLKDYWFCCHNTPKQFGYPLTSDPNLIDLQSEQIHRCIRDVSETRPMLRPSKGLSTNADCSISFSDFKGDSGPKAFTENGTYFGKLKSRNVFEDKLLTVYYFHIKNDHSYEWADAKAISYIAKSFISNNNDEWQLKAAGILSKIDLGTAQFPKPQNSQLIQGAGSSDTTLFVDSSTDYSNTQVIAINEELLLVTAVDNNLLPNAQLTVVRGSIIINSKEFRSEISDHDAGDSVQICYVADDRHCADIVRDMLFSAGVPDAYMPVQDWKNEIDQFVPEPRVTWIFAEPEDVAEQVKQVLSSFTVDIFEDVESAQIQVTAGSSWQQSTATLRYGIELGNQTLRITEQESMRFDQAWVSYAKSKPLENQDLKNFAALVFAINADAQAEGLYEPKDKQLGPYGWLTKDSAELLASKYVLRFGFMPERYAWNAEERFLTYKVGDVVTLDGAGQDADGNPLQVGAQITQISPRYNAMYRYYVVQALTYIPANTEGQVFIINGGTDINLYSIAGAPPNAVNLIFLIDGNIGASTTAAAGLTAGPFASGSNLTIIVRNGSDIQGKGGDGGKGGDLFLSQIDPPQGNIILNAESGEDGGIAFDASGQNVTIYLTGSAFGYNADGYLYAPGGGGAGGYAIIDTLSGIARTGHGGGGGAGRVIGSGGDRGEAQGPAGSGAFLGFIGNDGTETCTGGAGRVSDGGLATSGSGGDCGEAGESQSFGGVTAGGGAAGSGVILNGGNVTVITNDPSRFINGNGDQLSKSGTIVTLEKGTMLVRFFRYDDRQELSSFPLSPPPLGPDLSGPLSGDITTDGEFVYIQVISTPVTDHVIYQYTIGGAFVSSYTLQPNNFDARRGLVTFEDGNLGIANASGVGGINDYSLYKYDGTLLVQAYDGTSRFGDTLVELAQSTSAISTWLLSIPKPSGAYIEFYENDIGVEGEVTTQFRPTNADIDNQGNLLSVQNNFRVYVHSGRTDTITESFDLPFFDKWAFTPINIEPAENRILLENGSDFFAAENNDFVVQENG